ncbi:MAG: NYN domain-containing protein [Pseudomonadales bacterium]
MTDVSAQKISIFVDVQNIYYTCRQAYQASFDYNKFWAEITAGREVVDAVAYATDRGDEKQQQFQNILRAIGFTVKLKPMLSRHDGTAKADWDVGIALDVFEAAEHCDTVVLASGDGDFDVLLQRIKQRFNTDTEVYGVPQLTSNLLVKQAYKFRTIDESLLINKTRR